MREPRHPEVAPSEDDPRRDRLVGLLAVEAIALGIALATPLTPSKAGSTWSPAHLFTPDPSYLEKVAASFVVVNILMLGLGLIALLISKREGAEK